MVKRSAPMKRGEPMKRTAMKRGTTRVGEAARRRIRGGGVTSKSRLSLSAKGYAELRRIIIIWRAGERDEATGERLPFAVATLDHCKPRSAGGEDSWQNCWSASTDTQRWKESAYASSRGRLFVTALGNGAFRFRHATGTKANPIILRTWTGGRGATDEERSILDALR